MIVIVLFLRCKIELHPSREVQHYITIMITVLAAFVSPHAHAEDYSGMEAVCVLSAERDYRANISATEVFTTQISCVQGEMPPERKYDDPPRNMTLLHFPARYGENVIIGASLSDGPPSGEQAEGIPTPDFDFPVRFFVIATGGEKASWSFSIDAETAASYKFLVMRVWNPSALVDCAEGRDGCEKFGYALLGEELRVTDALELKLE